VLADGWSPSVEGELDAATLGRLPLPEPVGQVHGTPFAVDTSPIGLTTVHIQPERNSGARFGSLRP
jgi:hypothetical protein